MNNLKRISSIALSGIVLFGTICFAKTGTVNAPNGLILREEASKSGEIIMTVSDKSKVEIQEKDGEWYKVKYNSHEGYLFAEYVEVQEKEETEQTVESTQEQTEDSKPVEEDTNNEEKQFPQKQKVKSNLKIYLIPSVTAKTIADVTQGTEVTINYELNNWVNITYGNTQGWARKYFVNTENKEKVEDTKTEETKVEDNKKEEETKTTETVIDNKKGYVDVSNSANLREKASTSSNIINTLLRNTEVTIIAEEGDFYKIKYQDITGYMAKELISEKPVAEVTSRGNSGERNTSTQINESAQVKDSEEKTEETTNNTATSNSSNGSNVVSYAKKYIGYDYVSGGTTPNSGFDCSGFTYYVYNSCGYSLSRSCQTQAKTGTAVSRQNLKAGDLVFFNNGSNGSIGHVGIYIGDGQFVHAENSRTGVRIDTINSGYYNKYYYSARRIVD